MYIHTRYLIFLFLLCCQAYLIAQEPAKILFVGNSYTYYWDLPKQVELMGKSSNDVLQCFQSTTGGSHWGHHWKGEKGLHTKEFIEKINFDAVVLQNNSLSAFNAWDSIFHYGRLFGKLIDAKNAKIYLFQTWTREWAPERQDSINLAYKLIAKEIDATVVPVGDAWQRAIKLKPGIKLYEADGSHPTALGSYLAACVFYQIFTDKSPIGLPAFLIAKDKNGENVYLNKQSPELALFCQKVAFDIVNMQKLELQTE